LDDGFESEADAIVTTLFDQRDVTELAYGRPSRCIRMQSARLKVFLHLCSVELELFIELAAKLLTLSK